MDSLEAYEQRLKICEEDSVENVFQSKLKLRSQNKEYEENKRCDRKKNKRFGYIVSNTTNRLACSLWTKIEKVWRRLGQKCLSIKTKIMALE